MKIVKLDAYVKGDKMTVAAQKDWKKKPWLPFLWKAGGGYQFIYTKDQGGIVYVYPDKYGEKYKEGTFTRSSLAVGNSSYRKYEIKLDGMERTYIVQRYYPSKTRSVAMVPYGFYEDLLDQFTDDYPEVESVYTMQVVSAVFWSWMYERTGLISSGKKAMILKVGPTLGWLVSEAARYL